MSEKIIIAIDGFSSTGKSTLAKELAKRINYGYIDTGAMYRAVTLYFLRNDVDLKEDQKVKAALANVNITFQNIEGINTTFLNGENVEEKIRTLHVSQSVSDVAAISAVRRAMVSLQQAMGDEKGIVMDGRDIGTVVFPYAELKIFVTADPKIRAKRRYDELVAKGQNPKFEEVADNLKERDHIDSTREDSPLRQADDAILIDNSNLTREEQLEKAINMVKNVLEAKTIA